MIQLVVPPVTKDVENAPLVTAASSMSIYESSKDFLGSDPNQKFLDFPPPKGYDPLAMDREMRKAVEVIGELLAEKWKEESGRDKKSSNA